MSGKIRVFYGSVRTERQGIKAARFFVRKLADRGYDARLVDPKDFDFGLLDRMYKEYAKGEAPEAMERLGGDIRTADGFLDEFDWYVSALKRQREEAGTPYE